MNPALALLLLGTVSAAEAPRHGSLIFLENSNRIVEAYTDSSISHVSIVIYHGSEPWVYEATPPEVRRIRYTDYLKEMGALHHGRKSHALNVLVRQPRKAFAMEERNRIRSHAEEQLGRRYSIKNYVRQRPGDGMHCAEFAASTLEATGRIELGECCTVSPGLLFRQLNHTYLPARKLELPQVNLPWRQRSWDWLVGCMNWCGWSCWETMTFCR